MKNSIDLVIIITVESEIIHLQSQSRILHEKSPSNRINNLQGCGKISHPTFPISSVRLFANALSDIGELTYKASNRRSLPHPYNVSPTRADKVYANRPNTDMEKWDGLFCHSHTTYSHTV